MKTSTEAKLIKEIADIEAKREALFKIKKPIDESLVALHKQKEKAQDKLAIIQTAKPKTPEEEINYFLHSNGNEGQAKYNAGKKFFGDMGLNKSGIYPETGQVGLSLMMTKGCNKSYEKTLATINLLLPHMKPLNEGYKIFSIFEHTLSEYGCYSLFIHADGTFEVSKMAWHRRSTEAKFNTLEEVITYIQVNHYYNRLDEEDETN